MNSQFENFKRKVETKNMTYSLKSTMTSGIVSPNSKEIESGSN